MLRHFPILGSDGALPSSAIFWFFDDSNGWADVQSSAIQRAVSPHPGPLPMGEGERKGAAWLLEAHDFKSRVAMNSLSSGRGLG